MSRRSAKTSLPTVDPSEDIWGQSLGVRTSHPKLLESSSENLNPSMSFANMGGENAIIEDILPAHNPDGETWLSMTIMNNQLPTQGSFNDFLTRSIAALIVLKYDRHPYNNLRDLNHAIRDRESTIQDLRIRLQSGNPTVEEGGDEEVFDFLEKYRLDLSEIDIHFQPKAGADIEIILGEEIEFRMSCSDVSVLRALRRGNMSFLTLSRMSKSEKISFCGGDGAE